MGMLARLRERSLGPKQRLARELRTAYGDARRLAGQLREHAARAPYPAHAADLGRLADQADGHAGALADALRTLTGAADPVVAELPRSGRNQWERLTTDLADVVSLQRRYGALALECDVDFPATATVAARLAQSAAAMAGVLRAIIARSDPHAAD